MILYYPLDDLVRYAKSKTRPSGSASEEVLSGGAVAALSLPGAVPYGLHSCWLPYEELPGP